MIAQLETLLRMHNAGMMPMKDLVSLVVKCVAQYGDKADFEALPINIQKAVLHEINLYRKTGKWLVISNLGRENYAPYAKAFMEKVPQNARERLPVKIKRNATM